MSDERRPDGLGKNVVEPRCGDLVTLRHLDDPALCKVRTASRPGEGRNLYGFDEVDGGRVFNLSEAEYVALYDTDKTAHWPLVYAQVDLMHRRRDHETGGITYHGEVLDDA